MARVRSMGAAALRRLVPLQAAAVAGWRHNPGVLPASAPCLPDPPQRGRRPTVDLSSKAPAARRAGPCRVGPVGRQRAPTGKGQLYSGYEGGRQRPAARLKGLWAGRSMAAPSSARPQSLVKSPFRRLRSKALVVKAAGNSTANLNARAKPPVLVPLGSSHCSSFVFSCLHT